LELILTLPILVILVLAIAQFGIFFANMQQVTLACREGAKEASETLGLPTTDGALVPTNVLEAIDSQLTTSRIHACRVRLEHNVGGAQVALFAPADGGCDCCPGGKLGSPLPPRSYVRLTVCVELEELMPNCLALFGFDVCDVSQVIHATSIFRYEREP
jgi:hypothetical protein